jgi:uncharacterized protein
MGRTRGHRWIGLALSVMAVGLIAGCRSEADRLPGKWQGTLNLPLTTLQVGCSIQKNSDGTLGGTIDSLGQGAAGIPLDTVTIKDGAVHLQCNKIFASYDGQLSKDGSQIVGQWKQGPASLSMTFQKQ